jgi:hypothetical protein
MPIVYCSLGSEWVCQMETPDWVSLPRELSREDCRHLYHPNEDSASHRCVKEARRIVSDTRRQARIEHRE